MNTLLVVTLVFTNVVSILCIHDTYETSIRTPRTITVDAQHKCISGSVIKEVEASYSYIETQPRSCTGVYIATQDVPYSIKFDDEFVPLSFYNLTTIRNIMNGDHIFTQTGLFDDSVCGKGKVHILVIIKNSDIKACLSETGLTHVESSYASFKITGGECEGTCFGKLKVDYNPGLVYEN